MMILVHINKISDLKEKKNEINLNIYVLKGEIHVTFKCYLSQFRHYD